MTDTRRRSAGAGRVSLRKRKGGNWYARFRDAGKLQEVTLKVTNKVLAEKKAAQINGALEAGEPWEWVLGGARQGERTFEEFAIEDFLPRFCDWSPTTRRSEGTRFGILFEEFGKKPLSSVTPQAIKAWLSRRQAEGLSVASSNRYLSLFKSVYKAAVAYGYCKSNPAASVKVQAEPVQVKDVLTDDEFERLLAELPEAERRVVLCAADTGMRRSELGRLAWEDVDLVTGELYVRIAKNRTFRTVPLTARLAALMAEMRGEATPHPKAPVFASVASNRALSDARARAGIDKTVTMHSFRHLFATRALEAGVSPFHLQAIGGWKSPVMLQRYGKVRSKALHEQMAKLNEPRGRVA